MMAAALPALLGSTTAASIATAGLGLASQMESARQATKQANAQNEALYKQGLLGNALNEQQMQQQARQTAEEAGNVARQALAEKARLTATATERGLTGNTLGSAFREIQVASNTAQANILEGGQRANTNSYMQRLAQNSQLDSQARMNQLQAKSKGVGLFDIVNAGTQVYMDSKLNDAQRNARLLAKQMGG